MKTPSELLFEAYLDAGGYGGTWEFELPVPGQTKKPDYRLKWRDSLLYFEVKETHAPRSGSIRANPYKALRSEINEACRQFKALKCFSCSLVVHNIDNREIRLDPRHVFGAMLGDLGFTANFNDETGQIDTNTMRNAFLSGGKMVDPNTRRPQNTTMSSVIVLEKKGYRPAAFLEERNGIVREREAELGRAITGPEFVGIVAELVRRRKDMLDIVRIVTVENPFARHPLPAELFRGPYDERWRYTDRPSRVYAGEPLSRVEQLEAEIAPRPQGET